MALIILAPGAAPGREVELELQLELEPEPDRVPLPTDPLGPTSTAVSRSSMV